MAEKGGDTPGAASGLLGCAVLLIPVFLVGKCAFGGGEQPEASATSVASAVVAAPSSVAKPTPPAPAIPPARRNHPVKIEAIAIDPYTRADYPDVYRRYGRLIPAINKERRQAARAAAVDGRCDGVENVQITDYGTATDRHYMVECDNMTRLYFNRASLVTGRAVASETELEMRSKGLKAY